MLHRGDDEIRVEVGEAGALGLFEQRNPRRVSQDWPFHPLDHPGNEILHVVGARLALPHLGLWTSDIIPLSQRRERAMQLDRLIAQLGAQSPRLAAIEGGRVEGGARGHVSSLTRCRRFRSEIFAGFTGRNPAISDRSDFAELSDTLPRPVW